MVGANLAVTSGILSGSILFDLQIVACRAAASFYDTLVQVRLRQSLWQGQCSPISAGSTHGEWGSGWISASRSPQRCSCQGITCSMVPVQGSTQPR